MHHDFELIKQLKSGNLQAFNALFDAYSHRLYAFGLKYMKSSVDAEELVQDVFLKIWKNHEKLNEEKNFKSYLFTIAFNQIKEYFQHKSIFLESEFADRIDVIDNATERSITYKSIIDHVSVLLEQLPIKKREIFKLSRFEGLSAKDIADMKGISSKTVDNQISEVIGFLKKHLNYSDPFICLFFFLFLEQF